MGARGQYLRLSEAKALVRKVGGEQLVRRIERGEKPSIYFISPISHKERDKLEQAIKTIRQKHGFF